MIGIINIYIASAQNIVADEATDFKTPLQVTKLKLDIVKIVVPDPESIYILHDDILSAVTDSKEASDFCRPAVIELYLVNINCRCGATRIDNTILVSCNPPIIYNVYPYPYQTLFEEKIHRSIPSIAFSSTIKSSGVVGRQ
ncbi:MAG: hypothetical protein ACOC34_03825 [Thermotogota bacterium]